MRTRTGAMRPGPRTRWRQQQGLSLIELLVSTVLGLLIVGALLLMYLAGSGALRSVQVQAQMNEDAQMALSVLVQELRMAGYNPTRAGGTKNDLKQKGWGILVCDNGFVNDKVASMDLLNCASSPGSAALAVAYEADLYSGKLTSSTPPLPRDCIGNGVSAVPVGADFYIMQARLWVEGGALRCRGSGSFATAQVLAENVESIAFAFAVTDPAVADSNEVRGYLSASALQTEPTLAALPPLDRWNKVVAVRVCVVIQSEAPVLQELGASAAAPVYRDCNGSNTAITDGRLRRAYRTTVILRNHGAGYESS